MKIKSIPPLFGITEIQSICEVNTGHINRTFIVSTPKDRYILQALNQNVFKSPEDVMFNIEQTQNALYDCTDIKIPHFLKSENTNYVKKDKEIWRMYTFCEETEGEEKLYRTGYSYGTFIRVMSSSNAKIKQVIKGFHDFNTYYSKLTNVCSSEDVPTILTNLKEELSDCFDSLPQHIIHGDAKTDNIILGNPCTILDLDTVMTGPVALDYGDMIRSVCNDKIDIEIIRELTHGFKDGLKNLITEKEKNSLFHGILWTTGELSLRYLTDYHSERRYFIGKTREQCLERSNELIKQLNAFISAKKEICSIINK